MVLLKKIDLIMNILINQFINNYTMNKLPTELKIEIQRFLKNKFEVLKMCFLSSNNFNARFILYKIQKITYVCISIKLLKWYINNFGSFYDELIYMAGRTKHMKKFKQRVIDFNLTARVFYEAAKRGNLKNMKWLKKNNCSWSSHTFACAAKFGNLKNMKWLKKNNCPWSSYTFTNSMIFGSIKNMKWLKKHNCPMDVNTSSFFDSVNVNLKTIKWLKKNGCIFNGITSGYAARFGNIKIMKWLKKHNCPYDAYAFEYAAEKGILKNMKWLKKNNFPLSEKTFTEAVCSGNLKNMKWLKKQNCLSLNKQIINIAIESSNNGNVLKNIKWLKKQNYEINANVVLYAVQNNSIKIIKWLVDNSSINYFGRNIHIKSIQFNSLEKIGWLIANNFQMDNDTIKRYCDLKNMKFIKN